MEPICHFSLSATMQLTGDNRFFPPSIIMHFMKQDKCVGFTSHAQLLLLIGMISVFDRQLLQCTCKQSCSTDTDRLMTILWKEVSREPPTALEPSISNCDMRYKYHRLTYLNFLPIIKIVGNSSSTLQLNGHYLIKQRPDII